ncbi:MAG: hypothetical protein AB7P03_14455 [Kofleriaceae bacterium]
MTLRACFGFLAAVTTGCMATGSDSGAPTHADPLLDAAAVALGTGGTFAARYRVPVHAGLDAAAEFEVDRVRWKVEGNEVELRYRLPVGLVGGRVEVRLSGFLEDGASTVDLVGDVGVASCAASSTTIECHEIFDDLGPLPRSVALVEQAAAIQYEGPISDRVQVANLFGSDPIGVVHIELDQPYIDQDPAAEVVRIAGRCD